MQNVANQAQPVQPTNSQPSQANQQHSSQSESKVQVVEFDLATLEEVPRERTPLANLNDFVMQPGVIERIEIVKLPSPYSKSADKKSHKLRITGKVVHTVTTEDGSVIEFRPNELIGLEEDKEGNLKGLPEYEKSQWQRFKRTLRISKPEEAVGKTLPIRVNTNKDGREFLGFLY